MITYPFKFNYFSKFYYPELITNNPVKPALFLFTIKKSGTRTDYIKSSQTPYFFNDDGKYHDRFSFIYN